MFKLKIKILGGYLLITVLFIIFMVAVFLNRFTFIENKVTYLSENVAQEVKIANQIRTEMLTMKTSVEKYIYRNTAEDKKAADQSIINIKKLLSRADQIIKSGVKKTTLKNMKTITTDFIKRFQTISRQIAQIRKEQLDLHQKSKDIVKAIELILKKNQDGFELAALTLSLDLQKKFIFSEVEVKDFLLTHKSGSFKNATNLLDQIDISEIPQFKKLNILLKNYTIIFKKLGKTILTMDLEIEKAILPLMPQIAGLSTDITDAGWKEMELAVAKVNKVVEKTSVYILMLACAFILGGTGMAYYLARMITNPIIKVLAFAEGVSKGDLSQTIEIKQKDEIGQMAKALNNILTEMLTTQQKLMNNLYLLPSPVIEVDREFTIININRAGCRMRNLKSKDMIGKKCYQFFNSEHCHTSKCMVECAMQEDRLFTGETCVDPEESNIPIRYTGFPVKALDGSIIGAVKYVVDISDERKINMEIRDLIKAVHAGELEKRADSLRFTGSYAELINNANEIVNAFLKPIQSSQKVLMQMASKDLCSYVEGDFKGDHAMNKDAINNVLDIFNIILLQVRKASDNLAVSAGQLTLVSQSLTEGAQEQVASVEQITTTIYESEQQIKSNADSAFRAHQLVGETNQAASSGMQEMEAMIASMKEINKSSQDISDIINVIEEIASQTHILSLNTAVEAAKTGEFAKSFIVIAQEVRELARRSADAAKESARMIKTSNKKVSAGVKMAEKTGAALQDIVDNVIKIKDLVAEISGSSQEQAMSISQVSAGMGQISRSTQNISAQSEETAAASEELFSLSENLKKLLSQFRLKDTETEIQEEETEKIEQDQSTQKLITINDDDQDNDKKKLEMF